MFRRLLNLVTVLSLLLCVAVVALWVRSYIRRDTYWRVAADQSHVGLHSLSGVVLLIVGQSYGAAPPGNYWSSHREMFDPRPASGVGVVARLGFWHTTEQRAPGPWDLWMVPHWAIVAASALLPAVRVARWHMRRRRIRRARRGLCAACGYDLTGNVSGVCPECAQAVVTTP